MTKQLIKIDQIKRNKKNPRTIKDAKFKKLVQSLIDFPEMMEKRPIVVDENLVVLGGNMRLAAAKEAGFKDVWIDIATDWTKEQKQAFIIKDNLSYGEWDFDLLLSEFNLDDLEEFGFDLPKFEDKQDESPEDKAKKIDEDIENENEDIETDIKEGDLFELNNNKLLCADSTNIQNIKKLLKNKKANLILTDPPYEISLNPELIDEFSENANIFIFQNDRESINYLKKSKLDFKKFFIFYHGGVAIPQEGGKEPFLRHIVITHETKGNALKMQTKEGLSSVINSNYRHEKDIHKHAKPVSSILKIVKPYSNNKTLVFDLFLGGGSTMLASIALNLTCYGIEIDPKNCEKIIRRVLKTDDSIKIKRNGVDETQKWIVKL